MSEIFCGFRNIPLQHQKKKKKKKEIDQPVGIDWYTSICYKGVAVHDDDESDECKRVGLPW